MIKITEITHEQETILKIEGKLTGPAVGELEQTCDRIRRSSAGGRLVLDLVDVSFVDEVALGWLRAIRHRDIGIANPSLFVSALMGDAADVPLRDRRSS